MTIQELINALELCADRNAEVLIHYPSYGRASQSRKLESVEQSKGGQVYLNTPGVRLPTSTDGAVA